MKYILLLVLGLAARLGDPLSRRAERKACSRRVGQARRPAAIPNTIVVSISDSFLDGLLGTVFRDLGPPSFKLAESAPLPGSANIEQAAFQGGCANSVTLAAEGNNVKTNVDFAGGKISAPLVFSGNYNLLGNCMQFKGWAQTSIQLSFDQSSQTLYGRMNVEGVNLENVSPIANNFVTVFVRTAIDQRVNPLQILRPQQLQLLIPVQASNGSVKATVKEVHSEVQDGSLHLHITYDFAGAKGQQPQV